MIFSYKTSLALCLICLGLDILGVIRHYGTLRGAIDLLCAIIMIIVLVKLVKD